MRRALSGIGVPVCLGIAVTALVSAACTAGQLLLAARPNGPAELVAAANAVRAITFAGTALLLVIWLYRARVNLATLRWARPRWAPAWVVGALVVPVLGPFIFTAIMADVARESVPPAVPATAARLNSAAWAWLATALPAAVLFGAAAVAPDPASYALLAGAEGCQLTAAVLLLMLVRAVTWWQDAAPAPAWTSTPVVPAPRQPHLGDATMRT
jgi:hypothetical protein